MNIEDIEVGEKYVVKLGDRQVVSLCYAVDEKDARFTVIPHSLMKTGRIPPEDVRPYTEPPRRSVDELEDYAESTDREAHREPESDGGFECVWRVRCCGEHDEESYLDSAGDLEFIWDASLFTTQSDALKAAEDAGWYVDAEKALCPECRPDADPEPCHVCGSSVFGRKHCPACGPGGEDE